MYETEENQGCCVTSQVLRRVRHFTRRYGALYLADAVSWAAAIVVALALRFDFEVERIHWGNTLLVIGATVVLQLIGGWISWLYRNRYEVASFDEVRALVLNTTGVVLVSWLIAFVVGYGNGIPRSTMIIAAPIAFSFMGLTRYLVRMASEQQLKPDGEAGRVIIYGAGYVGSFTVRRMLTDVQAQMLPVAMLDDDPEKSHTEVRGVRVMGTLEDLPSVARATGASTVIVCIGYADSRLLRRTSELAEAAGIEVLVLPPLEQIMQGSSELSDVRALSIEDLIGRYPVTLETQSIASYLRDRTVLVTGAGGSIGSEICRQLTRFSPKEIVMLDRDESGLQETQLSISGHGLLDTSDVVLADIRDADTLVSVFAEHRPDVVFHAAALKHLPMLEQYPEEAWKTNVLGTLNVLRAARAAGVRTFVNISTDKAANPTSVLGHSKRVAEKLTAWMAKETGSRYLSVRFGNVIGSRGSMLPTFRHLIEQGGPLTITHPEVTRYFMTIPEASQLVIQAGGIGRPGEVLILDMGDPVSILDVAKRMIESSGKHIDIVYTGLRHGEKIHEELVTLEEGDERPFHEKISHARVDTLSPDGLDHATWIARMQLTDEAEGRVQ